MAQILAAADIGSNTAHLLIAEVSEAGLRRIINDSDWLSLGEVVSREGALPMKLADRLISTLKEFRQKAQFHRAESIYVFATEAMRRASNHDEILQRIADTAGFAVEIISPRREAELSLRAVQGTLGLKEPFILVEAGGGSVQVASCADGKIGLEVSLPIGTGAIIAKAGLDQSTDSAHLASMLVIIEAGLRQLKEFPVGQTVVACGGVARGIWRALHPDGDPIIELKELEYLSWDSSRLSTFKVAARYGVKPKRAATLLPGSFVYLNILRALGADSMRVSEVGVREGAIWEMSDRSN